ncbi:MAG: hypothetical protein KAV82_06645 [Phycisphaerae bacterium]|nr:hypothetical protein [Phycisphaerae bacterium]
MRSFIALSLALAVVSGADAAPTLEIVPEEILVAPGDTAQFEVRLVDATQLSGFYLELGLTPEPEATGSVGFLSAFGHDDPQYCFHGFNDLFQGMVIDDDLLAVGDMTSPPDIEVTTTAGVNDLLAIIEVETSLDAWGAFEVTIDAAALELFDQYGDDIPDFAQTVIGGATIIVPEPGLALLLALGALLARRRAGIGQ